MRTMEGFRCGINLGGWLSQCRHMTQEHLDTFITREDIRRIAEMGFDHVRLPVDYNAIEEEDGTPKENGWKYVENCLSWCRESGLKVVLDLHKAWGYSFDPSQTEEQRELFFHSDAMQDRFIALWTRMARAIGSRSDVAFDLLNEVVPVSVAEIWNDIADRAIAAIRPYAPENWILVGGVRYNNVASVPMLRPPRDRRIVYNFHSYDPMIFTHQNAGWVPNLVGLRLDYPDDLAHYVTVGQERRSTVPAADKISALGPEMFEALYEKAIQHAEENDVPLYCGEYGVIDQADPQSAIRWLRDISTVFERHGIGRALWCYKRMDFGLTDVHYDGTREQVLKAIMPPK